MSMSERGTQTSHLKGVIQVLQLGNKSGILTVIHQTTVPEEGVITFVYGTITNVRLDKLPSQKALTTILGWDVCRFVFATVEINTEPQQISFQMPSTTGQLPRVTPSQSKPALSPHSQGSSANMTPKGDSNLRYPHPMNTPPALMIPRRIRQDAESMQRLTYAGLSRLHMRLFLLIDEERTLQDLARLLNHSPQEVQRLLYDLERIGIISCK